MKVASFFCFLMVLLCPGAQAATQLNIVVEERGHPAGVGVFVASVAGSEVAVIPGAFELTIDGSPDYSVQFASDNGNVVRMRFSYDNGHLHLDSEHTACSPVAAHGTLNEIGPQSYNLLLTYSKEESACTNFSDYLKLQADGYVKVRFDAKPSSATIFVRREPPLSDLGLPKVLNLKYYQPKTDINVFFKSEGYLDCRRRITITRQGDLYNVSVDDGSPVNHTNGNGGNDIPTISCELTKIH
jgi:hypothetical protein